MISLKVHYGISILLVTLSYQIELNACSIRKRSCLVMEYCQSPWASEIMDLTREPSTGILLVQYNSNCILNTYPMPTDKFCSLIKDASLGTR